MKSELNVLVVDDHEANARVVVEVLKHEGYQVRWATNGAQALNILNEWPAQLILLDQDMPGMTGIETLERIKLLELNVDIVFISAHSNPEFVKRCLDAGADDFIRKPFAVVELASRVQVRFRLRDLRQQLEKANKQLRDLSDRDDLTGLYNMRSMSRHLEFELDRSRRNETQVACIMLDMDYFKRVNDEHDHLFGSYVIREVGQILRSCVRQVDYPARYGGDEFILMIVQASDRGLQILCERMRSQVESTNFSDGRNSIRLTISIGYAISPLEMPVDPSELIRCADLALYEAKERGRNVACGWDGERARKSILAHRGKKKAA